jgi:hypothetical protein
MLQRRAHVSLALIVLDVLELRGRDLRGEPFRKRREILEGIDFGGMAHVPDAFTEGHALFDAVSEWEMEGVVAKRLATLGDCISELDVAARAPSPGVAALASSSPLQPRRRRDPGAPTGSPEGEASTDPFADRPPGLAGQL